MNAAEKSLKLLQDAGLDPFFDFENGSSLDLRTVGLIRVGDSKIHFDSHSGTATTSISMNEVNRRGISAKEIVAQWKAARLMV